ncbi:MAG: hypothetical protein WD824_02595 [Cyclobacteriaceae bacterium]
MENVKIESQKILQTVNGLPSYTRAQGLIWLGQFSYTPNFFLYLKIPVRKVRTRVPLFTKVEQYVYAALHADFILAGDGARIKVMLDFSSPLGEAEKEQELKCASRRVR